MVDQEDIVSIILVNYNGWQDTIECLESVLKLDFKNYNIVVIDNASTDGSAFYIKEWAKGNIDYNFSSSKISEAKAFPPEDKPIALTVLSYSEISTLTNQQNKSTKIVLIESDLNRGFAGGNNVATKVAKSIFNPYFFWYLNNDTVVERNSLRELIKYYYELQSADKKIGIIGAKLRYYTNPDIIQAMAAIYNPWFAAAQHLGNNEVDRGQYDRIINNISFDYAVGASMFINKNFIEEVGVMNEEYFLYFEELDWVNRGRKYNYTTAICANSIIYHKEGASTGSAQKSDLSLYFDLKNRLKFTRTFYPFFILPVYFYELALLFNNIRKGRFKKAKIILKILLNI